MYGLCGYPLWRCANVHMQALGCVYASWVLAVFFQVGGDEDQPEVGEEGLVGPVWRVAALRWCFMRLKTRSTMFRPLYASLSQSHGGRTVPLGRRDRRQAERLGRRPDGIPLVRAVHGRARAHERAGRGHLI